MDFKFVYFLFNKYTYGTFKITQHPSAKLPTTNSHENNISLNNNTFERIHDPSVRFPVTIQPQPAQSENVAVTSRTAPLPLRPRRPRTRCVTREHMNGCCGNNTHHRKRTRRWLSGMRPPPSLGAYTTTTHVCQWAEPIAVRGYVCVRTDF